MKKIWLILFILAAFGLTLAGCGEEPPVEQESVAKVNEFFITTDRFRDKVVQWAYFTNMKALSYEDRKNLLTQEIDKEILIQEAIHLQLQKEESFRRTIEKFWEQTLITALIEKKMKELGKSVMVTEEEVSELYKKMKDSDPDTPPLKDVRAKIEEDIRQKKKKKIMDQWLADLKKEAEIKIYEENLKAMR